jgi:hypothetical protein
VVKFKDLGMTAGKQIKILLAMDLKLDSIRDFFSD